MPTQRAPLRLRLLRQHQVTDGDLPSRFRVPCNSESTVPTDDSNRSDQLVCTRIQHEPQGELRLLAIRIYRQLDAEAGV